MATKLSTIGKICYFASLGLGVVLCLFAINLEGALGYTLEIIAGCLIFLPIVFALVISAIQRTKGTGIGEHFIKNE